MDDNSFLGLTEEEAMKKAKDAALSVRVVSSDGVYRGMIRNINPMRLNLVLEKNVIVKVYRG